ncbi:hypothetical protein THRCLA_09224 [Thraustotheca clavata]|uniref:Cytochrome P450 n=1 Tax=Thraustotheca clavata TaxID=74557 RepID=A0A1V9YYB3_9STRA|nr:hypothetical protein THRCLA_09224 [Thraustotheca clavata]
MITLVQIASAIGLLCLAGIFYLVYILAIAPIFSPLNALPGPPPTSIFGGNAEELSVFSWNDKNPFPGIQYKWFQQYGPVYHCRLLGMHQLIISDPDAVKYFMVTNAKNYPRSKLSTAYVASFTAGDGLLGTEDPLHTSQRKLFNPHFSHFKIREFVNIFKQKADKLAQNLQTAANASSVVNVSKMMASTSFDIIGLTAFGYEFDTLGGSSKDVFTAFEYLAFVPNHFIAIGIMCIPGFERLPLPELKRRREAKKILYKVVDDVISQKLAAPAIEARDILDLMLENESGVKMTPDEARTHVLTFLIAGHETTSSVLSSICYVLAIYPEVEKKVIDELTNIKDINWENLSELKYLNAVIYETIRLHPPLFYSSLRNCLEGDFLPVVDGKPIFVPKGTQLGTIQTIHHRNPQYWIRPDEFLPERFIDGSELNLADANLRQGRPLTYIYIPFSIGPNQCIGNRFAFVEMQIILATILAKFSFKLHASADTNPELQGLTIKRKNLAMTIHTHS